MVTAGEEEEGKTETIMVREYPASSKCEESDRRTLSGQKIFEGKSGNQTAMTDAINQCFIYRYMCVCVLSLIHI